MSAYARRWLAFAGCCLAGLALGELASIFNQYLETIVAHLDDSYQDVRASLWIACLAVGAGLGMAIAATIRE